MTDDDFFELGCEHFDNNDFQKAANCFERSLQDDPTNLGAIYNLALCYYEIGDYAQSISVSNQLLQISEDALVIETLFNRGNCYHAMYEYEKAIDDFSTIISIENDDSSAYFNRANAFSKLGKIEEANKDYEKVKELRGIDDLSRYYFTPSSEDITDESLDKFNAHKDSLTARNPYNMAERYFEEGNSYVEIREFEKALELFQKAADNYPQDFYESAHFNVINCLVDILEEKINFYITHNPDNEIINYYKKILDQINSYDIE
ncbi:MAG: tetratricopeptide repeat protein [Flavobacteriaceae bacterium]